VSSPGSGELEPRSTSLFGDEEVALVDLLDRLLAGGVVLAGDITISLAGVDLVRISLRALIMSIAPVERPGTLAARAERAEREAVTELEAGRG
jgi:hypothetical protein